MRRTARPTPARRLPTSARPSERARRRPWGAADAVSFATHAARDSAAASGTSAAFHVVGLGRNLDPRPHPRAWAPPRFLFVGGNWERKDGAGVLAAFPRVRRRYPAAELHLAGEHPSRLPEAVFAHGRPSLRWACDRRRLRALFESSTCFVMPSHREAAGIVFAEAAAAGIPSIGSTNGGAATMIGPGGVVVAPGDEDALVAAMSAFAQAELASETGARGSRYAKRLTWTQVAARIAAAIDGRAPTAMPAQPLTSVAATA